MNIRATQQAHTTAPRMPHTEGRKLLRAKITEHEHQCLVVQWRDANKRNYPGIHLLHAIPNGGKRSRAVAGKLRAEGVLSGVADLLLPVSRRGFHGLYLEMKSIGGKATPAQTSFIVDVLKQGYYAKFCWGADEAIATIRWYYGEE